MNAPPVPLLLLLGPSGVGKTTLGEHLSKALNWVHLDSDPSPRGNGRRVLRRHLEMPGALVAIAAELRQHAAATGSKGVVQSFGSTVYLTSDEINSARSAGLSVVYLSGEQDECLRSFLSREANTGRNLSADHWRRFNSAIFQHLDELDCQPHRLEAFSGGRRRSPEELVAEVQSRCVGVKT